ncbi:ATP-binding cassette domain-containing protein [Pendulispora brunnea]|uniref:ATP-binding cassette domain-containing protein n=1 Tax=Pendulispora brunnea TaxID=2905690 RepID=A0ABZ2K6D9_9BACT
MHEYAISADRIALTAGDFHFDVRDVGFRRGLLSAIVGPNGSGKSTLIEALLGFRTARLDNARILGVPAHRFMADVEHLRRMGTQLQRVEYADDARVEEILDLHRALYRRQSPMIAEALGLGELRKKPYRGLSKGQRQRLDLFVAMGHEPELMILDEPFTGLDKTYAGRLVDLLKDSFEGTTIVMICHSGEELAAADDLLWVHRGAIRYRGNRLALKENLVGQYRTRILLDDEDQQARVRALLATAPSVLRVASPHGGLDIQAFGDEGLDAVVRGLMESAHIRHFEFAPTSDADLLRVCTQTEAHV